MKRYFQLLIILLGVLALGACKGGDSGSSSGNGADATAPTTKPEPVEVPVFSADTAFSLIEKQLVFGPRTPGSPGHRACGDWMVAWLKAQGAVVTEQKDQVQGWDLDGNTITLPMRNIIASFQPEKGRRVLLSAHWDTRPYADEAEERQRQPIPGANDGGSGVAVLMEIARHLQENPTAVGIDLIFWDVEDHGNSEVENSFCLGSQYWGKTPHKPNYSAMYGINLDMVGGKGATFFPDGFSLQYGKPIVDKVWNKAVSLGYGKQFRFEPGGYITDDHMYVYAATGIPVIDIIDQRPNSGQTFFGQWHTHQDDIHIIDRETLKAVGETVMHVVYHDR